MIINDYNGCMLSDIMNMSHEELQAAVIRAFSVSGCESDWFYGEVADNNMSIMHNTMKCVRCDHWAAIYALSDLLTGRAKFQCECGHRFYVDYTRQNENEDFLMLAVGFTI